MKTDQVTKSKYLQEAKSNACMFYSGYLGLQSHSKGLDTRSYMNKSPDFFVNNENKIS